MHIVKGQQQSPTHFQPRLPLAEWLALVSLIISVQSKMPRNKASQGREFLSALKERGSTSSRKPATATKAQDAAMF